MGRPESGELCVKRQQSQTGCDPVASLSCPLTDGRVSASTLSSSIVKDHHMLIMERISLISYFGI
jgi:hypothetical protein